MVGFKLSPAVVTALALAGHVAGLEPIVAKGAKLFTKSGAQFYMKGVAYQQEIGASGAPTQTDSTASFIDPLSDSTRCARDVPLLQAIGTNTIRVYAIDPNKDHSACMAMLEKAGIYVIADLGEPNLSINRDEGKWDVKLFTRYKKVVDELGKYDNTIGFFAGNEVTNNATNTPASAFVKAAVRDTKKYIKDTKSRWMGVGYAANDDADIRVDISQYFNCGNPDDAIDFWGYNIYSWCGKSSLEDSGYSKQVEFFRSYSVPVFFAEYGCNIPNGAEGRIWDETTALYASPMTDVFSGGIVFKWFQEANDYGLVQINNGAASTMKNYAALKTKIAAVKPSSTSASAYSPTNKPAACPAISSVWEAAEGLPPTPDDTLCQCMFASLGCVPKKGLDSKQFGSIFNYICGQDPKLCAGISVNTKSGVYGAFSMCGDTEKLGFVLNEYFKSQKGAKSSCDFGGNAVLQSGNQAASCSAGLSSASAANSVAATATKGSTPTGTNKSIAGAQGPMRMAMGFGDMAVGLYAMVAMVAGGVMIAL